MTDKETTTEKVKKSSMIKKTILIVAILMAVASTFGILAETTSYHQGQDAYEDAALAVSASDDTATGLSVSVDFDELKKINREVKAWIYSKNTPINYPVVQGKNNTKYLTQMYNLNWNGCGAIFIDYRCENPFEDFNTIIYGHRMKDNSMFGSFGKYRSQKYFNKHSKITIITEDSEYEIELFAVVTIPKDSDLYKIEFRSRQEKEEYLSKIFSLNEISSEVEVAPEYKIIMLSTCTYEFDDARLVLYGKLEKHLQEKENEKH